MELWVNHFQRGDLQEQAQQVREPLSLAIEMGGLGWGQRRVVEPLAAVA